MTRLVASLLGFAFLAIAACVGLIFYTDWFGGPQLVNMDATGSTPPKTASDAANSPTLAARFDPDTQLEPDQLLVLNPPDDLAAVVRQLNYTIIDRYTLRGLNFTVARVRVPAGTSLLSARALLSSKLSGATVDYNRRFDASADAGARRTAEGATGGALDQLKKLGKIQSLAQAAIGWQNVPASCGKGIKLGMIDSGVDTSHPVLKGQDIEYRSFNDPTRKEGDAEHGTAVAALLVGKPTDAGLGGLLPGATLKAANMFERTDNDAMVGNSLGLLRGLDWLLREKVSVINMSIAGGRDAVVERGIKVAQDAGIDVVAAAGNWGSGAKPAYPGAFEEVIAVTAIDSYDAIYENANSGPYVSFAAPGVNILTAAPHNGSKHQSGTSFAAPFLTAILALEVANHGQARGEALLKDLSKSARDLGPNGKDPIFGWGLVQTQPKCAVS